MDLQELEKRYRATLTANQEAELDWQQAISHLEFQEFIDASQRYREVTGRRHPQTRIEQLRGFAAYLLHPPNGYLLPLVLLVSAMPLGVIAFHYQRETTIRYNCATGLLSRYQIAERHGASSDFYGNDPIANKELAGDEICAAY